MTAPAADGSTLPDRAQTALERHVAFFDRDGDGRVTVGEVFETLKMLGCSNAYAGVNAVGGMLARTTEPGLAAHDVVVNNAHRGKYRDGGLSGETGIFDARGAFDLDRFQETVSRYSRSGVDGLTESDINAMVEQISLPGSVQRSSAQLAFRLLLTIAGERLPGGELMMSRVRLRAFYEGELLPELASKAGLRHEEPIATTLGGVAIGALRAMCPASNTTRDSR